MDSITTAAQRIKAPGFAALAWLVALAAWISMDVANATWGWTRPAEAAYVLVTLAVPTAAVLLVVAQVHLARTLGGLGWVSGVGTGVTALGGAVGLVAWAVPVWATLIAIGMLLFGVPMLVHGRVPRVPGLGITLAFVPTALVGLAGFAETWISVPLAVSTLVLALGLRALGQWVATYDDVRS
ncbi:MAG: hypothetical protein ACRD0Q_06970 [Acidimicrobiales bacterium]